MASRREDLSDLGRHRRNPATGHCARIDRSRVVDAGSVTRVFAAFQELFKAWRQSRSGTLRAAERSHAERSREFRLRRQQSSSCPGGHPRRRNFLQKVYFSAREGIALALVPLAAVPVSLGGANSLNQKVS